MAFLHTCDCSNVPGASGPGVPLCTIVPRDVHFKKKKKKKANILLVQEPPTRNNRPPPTYHFHSFTLPSTLLERPRVTTYILKKAFRSCSIVSTPHHDYLCTLISHFKTLFIIGNIYNGLISHSQRSDFPTHSLDSLFQLIFEKCDLVAGDFNKHHPTWNNTRCGTTSGQLRLRTVSH